MYACLHIVADLLNNTVMVKDLGKKAKEIVREKILITRLPSYYLYMLDSIEIIRQIISIEPDKAEVFRVVKFVRLA